MVIEPTSKAVQEEWVIPVTLTKHVLEGAYPVKQKRIMAATVFAGLAALFVANYVGLTWFPEQFNYSFASLSFFVNIVILLATGFGFMLAASAGLENQKSNRFDTIEDFARDELGPWLEAQGVQNSFFVAYNTLMHGSATLDVDQNLWGATRLRVWLDGKTTKMTIWR